MSNILSVILRRLPFLSAVTLLPWATPASSREIYNSPAIDIIPGIIATDTLPEAMTDCDYHLRVEIPRGRADAAWAVTIGCAEGHSVAIELHRRGKSATENDYALPLEISVSSPAADSTVTAGRSFTVSENIDPAENSWSLLLQRRPGDNGLLCSVGQRTALLQFDTGAENPRYITAETRTPVKLARLSCFTVATERLTASGFATVADLDTYLDATTDQREGRWVYLDRDTDPRTLNTGGDYRLATVARDDGCIEIIYLGGAKSADGHWQPLRLKGLLTPTTFVNHYNLVWYDAYGSRIDAETCADITDGSILRLNFPLHGGSIRFCKVRP